MQAGSFLQGFVGACLACVVAACIAVGTLTIVDVGKQQVVACQQVNSLRATLVTILQNGERAAPSNPYFKQHPDQLAQAQQQYRYDLTKLQPVNC